jgi:hypothetical protein
MFVEALFHTILQSEQTSSQLHSPAFDVVHILWHKQYRKKRLQHCIFAVFEPIGVCTSRPSSPMTIQETREEVRRLTHYIK